ncbi:hypothetical protein [Pseudalkalibacillus caeni]|uniref:Uncharacterized protein n=1 Tax=Exobacillus caeni TaxID=2574798 RepID=A0A5R9F459_9BACL|nr:hypothetical protein [Pseudalkalibacillus caeni]TLS37289.1 hypothetical protein FCL54_12265 [Pseudalkalibacillus caeni]
MNCGNELTPATRQKQRKRQKLWVSIPVAASLLLGEGLGGYYYYEKSLTEASVSSFKEGEQLAKQEKYEEAYKKFEKAQKDRSDFPAAESNQKLMQLAMDVQHQLDSANGERKQDAYTDALARLRKTDSTLKKYDGELVEDLQKKVRNARTTVMVAELKYDMNGKETIDELKPILLRAESLTVKEAAEIADQVRKQIVEVAYKEANGYLTENHFTNALATVAKGLEINKNSEKLKNLQTAIKKKQTAFEQAQQKRIEQAMVAAAKEKEKNQTDALKLEEVTTEVNEFNELVVKGKVQSVATVPIFSVSIKYTVLNEKKEPTDNKGEIYVNPDTLYPDDQGTFDFMVLNLEAEKEKLKNYTVKITDMTWYLE